MAPFDPSQVNSNIGAFIGLSLFIAAIVTLFYLVVSTLISAHGAIPVAQRTRAQADQRRVALWLFGALAILSLLVNLYTFQEMIVNSYWNWASEHKQPFPVDVWTTPAWYPRPTSRDLQLARWMQENDLKDCVKVMAGSWRDYWWQQQHAAGAAVWSIFLAIEGRRRNIPYTWAFLPIAHFVGLSVAQNLFYIALLFTPVPLPVGKASRRPSGVFAPLSEWRVKIFGDAHSRPHTWVPHPVVYIGLLAVSFLCTALLPYGIDTPFQDLLLNVPQAICYLTLLITKTTILPASFGTNHRSIHAAHASTAPVFRTAALLSFTLYAASTFLAILHNTPPAHRTLQRLLHADDAATLSLNTLARYRVAAAKLLGALSDHPVVQRIGWDVLLSALSLCVWAAALDPRAILAALGAPAAPAPAGKPAKVKPTAAAAAVISTAVDKVAEAAAQPRAKPHKAAGGAADAEEHVDRRHVEAATEAAEGAALAWGLCVCGGLGAGMAGCVGAEEM